MKIEMMKTSEAESVVNVNSRTIQRRAKSGSIVAETRAGVLWVGVNVATKELVQTVAKSPTGKTTIAEPVAKPLPVVAKSVAVETPVIVAEPNPIRIEGVSIFVDCREPKPALVVEYVAKCRYCHKVIPSTNQTKVCFNCWQEDDERQRSEAYLEKRKAALAEMLAKEVTDDGKLNPVVVPVETEPVLPDKVAVRAVAVNKPLFAFLMGAVALWVSRMFRVDDYSGVKIKVLK